MKIQRSLVSALSERGSCHCNCLTCFSVIVSLISGVRGYENDDIQQPHFFPSRSLRLGDRTSRHGKAKPHVRTKPYISLPTDYLNGTLSASILVESAVLRGCNRNNAVHSSINPIPQETAGDQAYVQGAARYSFRF